MIGIGSRKDAAFVWIYLISRKIAVCENKWFLALNSCTPVATGV